MMEKEIYEFRYSKSGLFFICFFGTALVALLVFLLASELIYEVTDNDVIEALTGVVPFTAALILNFTVVASWTNRTGYGSLGDDAVEIQVNGKRYILNYAEIKSVSRYPGSWMYRFWIECTNGSVKIAVPQGWAKRDSWTSLRTFMQALEERVEAYEK